MNFQQSIISKWLAKHISTKVSFKITIRKRRVYIDIRWSWIWNLYFHLGYVKWWSTLMIDLLLFQLVTMLNSQKTFETEIHNEIWHINLYMNISISNWHIWSHDPTKMTFFILYQFFTRLLTSKHLKRIGS